MTLPIIHLNGSGKASLLNDYRSAMEKVRDAIDATNATCPNGRDYYVSDDPAAYTKARREHIARVTQLQNVYDELLALAMHCDA